MSWYVYTLADPITGEVRYVGQSSRPISRLYNHWSTQAAGNVRRWIRELGREPTLAIVSEHATEAESQIAERDEMIRRQQAGENLLNIRTKCGKHRPRNRYFSGIGERVRRLRLAASAATSAIAVWPSPRAHPQASHGAGRRGTGAHCRRKRKPARPRGRGLSLSHPTE